MLLYQRYKEMGESRLYGFGRTVMWKLKKRTGVPGPCVSIFPHLHVTIEDSFFR